MTEDIQPGDIFLVQSPIEAQRKEYKGRGFLPLDNLIHRINPTNYQDFYQNSFKVGGQDRKVPSSWLNQSDDSNSWNTAPIAFFPTYSFSASIGGGLNLALPIQGIPLGLSLLGARSAQCSVQISNPRTYGIDVFSLHAEVIDWARKPNSRDFLRPYASNEQKANYIRVVNRVFLAGGMNVTIQAEKSMSGGAKGGMTTPIEMVLAPSSDEEKKDIALFKYRSNINALNNMLQNEITGAGGNIRLVGASARSISLNEPFTRPLVFGYLGFDMEIGPDGTLGPPIPTRANLGDGTARLHIDTLYQNAELALVYVELIDPAVAGLLRIDDGDEFHLSPAMPFIRSSPKIK